VAHVSLALGAPYSPAESAIDDRVRQVLADQGSRPTTRRTWAGAEAAHRDRGWTDRRSGATAPNRPVARGRSEYAEPEFYHERSPRFFGDGGYSSLSFHVNM